MTVSTPTEKLIVSSSPHVSAKESVPRIMHTVWIALLPACIAGVLFFGYEALIVIGWTTIACVAVEAGILKARGMTWGEVRGAALDGSAIVTGVLLALNLPASSPWWMVLVGAVVAMSLGKHIFGGLGNNPFNPALVARVFLLISFPEQMVAFTPVEGIVQSTEQAVVAYQARMATEHGVDGATYATPLGKLKEAVRAGEDPAKLAVIQAEIKRDYPMLDLFLGRVGGSLGEVSVLALLIGAGILFWRRCITWHIPLAFIGMVAAFTGIAWAVDPTVYANPLIHVLSGGLLLGAFFMATDMVTSPVTPRGMLIFGAGCGLITAVIRLWGAYPEGVSFAILIMNGLVPIIEKYTKPRKFGQVKTENAA